jgi:hypothetical protein
MGETDTCTDTTHTLAPPVCIPLGIPEGGVGVDDVGVALVFVGALASASGLTPKKKNLKSRCPSIFTIYIDIKSIMEDF